jgi:MFS family permease
MQEVDRTILYGLLAAASPVMLMAALASLGTGRGRSTGVAFMGAFVLGQSAAYVAAFFIGSAFTEDGHDTAKAVLEIVLGAALLVVAPRGRTLVQPRGEQPARSEALFRRLERVGPALAFGVGLPLGIGAKRLAITVIAAGTVAVAGLGRAANVSLAVTYIAVATLTVWIPVALYLIFGTHADEAVARTRVWIVTHERQVTRLSALVLGVLLVLDGLVRLTV